MNLTEVIRVRISRCQRRKSNYGKRENDKGNWQGKS